MRKNRFYIHSRLSRLLFPFGVQPDIVTNPQLEALIVDNISDEGLSAGLPLYVSLFRSRGTIVDAGWALAGLMRIAETPDSEFVHVQELSCLERRQAILASAALPLIFEPQQVAGESYSDGGIGGFLRLQGNTPITPCSSAPGAV